MADGAPDLTEPPVQEFSFEKLHGEVDSQLVIPDFERELTRLTDPAAAEETLHWGRNYLYLARLDAKPDSLDVAVKQFRSPGGLAGLRQKFRGTKARLSWDAALAFQAAGLPTARPLILAESLHGGPSFFVTEYLADVLEARFVFRAAEKGELEETFPKLDYEGFLAHLGRTLRRMHDAGCWHRDLSIGNVLLHGVEGVPKLSIIDLNRARLGRRPTISERTRDLCRLRIFETAHQDLFLRAYWGEEPRGKAYKYWLYQRYHRGFLRKVEAKGKVRGGLRGFRDLFRVRRAHAHIPAAPEGAAARDKVVWDALSDQPHQHASRLEKAAIRFADMGGHLRTVGTLAIHLPSAWRRYQKLKRDLYQVPTPFEGLGVGLRPCPEAPEALLTALQDLEVRQVLLRLHPWQENHEQEEELARELHGRGYELAFALPQNRELVKDLPRWRASLQEIAERFRPFGHHFQVGQAVNRSKWGIWNYREYAELAAVAGEVLRTDSEVQILGPAVIDFEYHATAALLNLGYKGLDFDAVSALLYVDRRGAPENRQTGFDTVDKTLLLRAIAETSSNGNARCWITEYNWPLWEGPHSPAGKDVSVDEESQANYLLRYLLLTLGTGVIERAYWWQLVARGYGLTTLAPGGALQRRPAFAALATAQRLLGGTLCHGPLVGASGESKSGPRPAGSENPALFYQFSRPSGSRIVVGWSPDGARRAHLPAPAIAAFSRDGEPQKLPEGQEVELGPAPRYFELEEPSSR